MRHLIWICTLLIIFLVLLRLLRLPGFRKWVPYGEDQKFWLIGFSMGGLLPGIIIFLVSNILELPRVGILSLVFTTVFLSGTLVTVIYAAVLKDRKLAPLQALALGTAVAAFLLFGRLIEKFF